MLRSITVRGFALLEDVRVEFDDGLNVVTGETGAGKSLLVGALAFLLGDRADASRLREGAAAAAVEGLFDVDARTGAGAELARVVEERTGAPLEDGAVALSRTLDRQGRSRAFVNNRFVTRETLREIAAHLVVVHGQSEHAALARPAAQRERLDAYARLDEADGARASFAAARARAAAAAARIAEIRGADRQRLDRLDLVRFQAGEIRAAQLRAGEQTALESEFRTLSNAERIRARIAELVDACAESDGSARERLQNARRALEELAADAPALRDAAGRVEEARLILDDALGEARRFAENLDADPGRLAAITARLDKIGRVCDRFRVDEAGAIALLESLEAETASLEGAESACAELEAELARALAEMETFGRALTRARAAAAPKLAAEVQRALGRLGMERAALSIAVRPMAPREGEEPEPLRRSHADGFDEVAFEIAPNPGEPSRALGAIASGGELARAALAIEAACAGAAGAPTIVFDEIDENVGGRLGPALGEHLRRASAERQVLVVTHLAGVAAYADRHLRVAKEIAAGRTRTAVSALDDDARVGELAAMLSGDAKSDTARADALALRSSARRPSQIEPARPRRAAAPKPAPATPTAPERRKERRTAR